MKRTLFILLLGLVTIPISTLSTYYARTGQTNQDFFRLRDAIRADGACGSGLYLEARSFSSVNLPTWFTLKTIQYMLAFDDCTCNATTSAQLVQGLNEQGKRGWLIVAAPRTKNFADTFNLEAIITVSPFQLPKPSPFVFYRVQPRQ